MDSLSHWESAGRSLASWCASVERTLPALRTGAYWDREREKVGELQRQVFQAGVLHQHAAGFYLGWMRLLAELSGARYSPAGPSLDIAPGQKISVEG